MVEDIYKDNEIMKSRYSTKEHKFSKQDAWHVGVAATLLTCPPEAS